jgi:cytochrome c oxidase subunit 2
MAKRIATRLPILLSALLWGLPGFAADNEPLIPPAKFVYCTVCHGVDLKGNRNIEAPRLSGMETWYVQRQLEAFTSGWRGVHDVDLAGIEMRPMAQALSLADIADAARYANAVHSPLPETVIDGDAGRGESLFQSCAACHGPAAGGNETLGAPALTTQNDWYLVTQLKNFKGGIRGQNAEDTFGQQMRAAAILLPNEQAILDVVAYISTLQHNEEN